MRKGIFIMNASTLRANARETLRRRWLKAALVVLVFAIICILLILLMTIPAFGFLIGIILFAPLSYGLTATFIKIKRNEDFTYTTFLSEGFANFKKVWRSYSSHYLKTITMDYTFYINTNAAYLCSSCFVACNTKFNIKCNINCRFLF